MKNKLVALAIIALVSCQKEKNFEPCGQSPIDGNKTWTKKGNCYQDLGVFTWNRFQKVDKGNCPCL